MVINAQQKQRMGDTDTVEATAREPEEPIISHADITPVGHQKSDLPAGFFDESSNTVDQVTNTETPEDNQQEKVNTGVLNFNSANLTFGSRCFAGWIL